MIFEWFRYFVATVRQLIAWQENVHNWVGWLGFWLALIAVGVVLVLARDTYLHWERQQWMAQSGRQTVRKRGKRQLSLKVRYTLLALLPVLGLLCTIFVTCGTHMQRVPYDAGETIDGVQIIECKGPLRAPYGMLVIIGGFGSESPMLAEPRPFREVGRSGDANSSRDGIINLFRYRLVIHPQGGLGWNDARTAHDIAGRISGVIELRRRLLGVDAFPAVVVAHSRGTQIAELAPIFRNSDWTRIAVNPPAGLHWPVRLFGIMSSEIGEINELGQDQLARRLKKPSAPGLFPWSVAYQSGAFDYVVNRFPANAGLPTRNLLPVGGHASAFNRRNSVLWTDILEELEKEKPYQLSKRRSDEDATPSIPPPVDETAKPVEPAMPPADSPPVTPADQSASGATDDPSTPSDAAPVQSTDEAVSPDGG